MSIMTEKELCEFLKVDSVFLWKCRKQGLPHLKLGTKIIRYNLDDVLVWFSSEQAKTSDVVA